MLWFYVVTSVFSGVLMILSLVFLFVLFFGLVSVSSGSLVVLGLAVMSSAFLGTLVVSQIMSSWFSFILFLIYISGLLVLFGYMVAMTPNVFMGVFGVGGLFLFFFFPFFFLLVLFRFLRVGMVGYNSGLGLEWEVSSLFFGHNLVVYWLVVVVLLVALIIAVSLCYKSPKPLRSYLMV